MTIEELLRWVNETGERLLPMDRAGVYRNIFGTGTPPYTVKRAVAAASRKGWVESISDKEGEKLQITDEGRRQVMLKLLEEMKPKTGSWDGKWRVVFFDVGDKQKVKRDKLRRWLVRIGFKKLQESVYISKYDYRKELEYARQALNIEEGVRLGVLAEIEL